MCYTVNHALNCLATVMCQCWHFFFLIWIHLVKSDRKLNKHWLRIKVKILIYVRHWHSLGPGPGSCFLLYPPLPVFVSLNTMDMMTPQI